MTTIKTSYKVSDGYAVRKFDEYLEAIKFATDCYKDHTNDGKTREEAAKLVTITTYTTEEETFWDTFGADMFEDEPKPSRDDLSDTMREELDRLESEYKRAQDAEDFEEWYTGGKITLEEIRNRYDGKRGEMRGRMIEDAKLRYERALGGILDANAKQPTIDALERRGFVKYEGFRRVRLLTI